MYLSMVIILFSSYIRANCNIKTKNSHQHQQSHQIETTAYYLPRSRRNIGGSFPVNYYTEKSVARHSTKDLFFGVLLPSDEYILDRGSTRGILAGMELAIDKVVDDNGILPGFNITMEYRDTMCSSTHGALAAFDIILKRKPGLILSICICNRTCSYSSNVCII